MRSALIHGPRVTGLLTRRPQEHHCLDASRCGSEKHQIPSGVRLRPGKDNLLKSLGLAGKEVRFADRPEAVVRLEKD